MPVLSVAESVIYTSALLKNASENTKITIGWYYLSAEEEILIDEVKLNSVQGTNKLYSSLNKPDNDFPQGEYEVRFMMNEYPDMNQSVKFMME